MCFKLFYIFKMRHLKKVATGGVHEKRWSFAKFTGKYMCRSKPESLLKKRLQKRYFTVIFTISSFIWTTNFLSFSSNLPNVYLVHFASVFFAWVFLLTYPMFIWFTLHLFLFYISIDNDHKNSFDSYKVCALFVDWINCHLVFCFELHVFL